MDLPPVVGSVPIDASTTGAGPDFASDPRVYFYKETNTWRFEDDDGKEMEYDAATKSWAPVLDEDLVKAQQAAYSVAGVDEETPAAPVLARAGKKRKGREDHASPSAGNSSKRTRAPGDSSAPRKSKNTAVYVTGLPPDTEQQEIVSTFSKCGVIEEDDGGEPKVKMYAREDGSFSGEALVVYFKEDSVELALNILDDTELRLGDLTTRMKVQRANFSHKGGGGDAPRKTVDKNKVTKRIGKMQKKLQEWGDEDGFGPSITDEDGHATHKGGRVVVLKHMFTLKELEEDVSLLLDLKEDVREECASLGEVTNVILYDKEPEGIMTVKFRDEISAQACLLKMNGRYFAGRRIEAALSTGKERFKRSRTADEVLEEGGDEAEKQRLEEFGKYLMTE